MNSKLKLLQLDHESHADERHDHPEGLFVTRGEINLVVDGAAVAIKKGGMYVVPPGALHSVEADSDGTVVIFD
ncbi:MAG TPA: cupin domain-containing protein [Thermoanaerobaculia bacterium]|nr:cupin domain-containing protein [Thermoanaerobaculia bacterium]